MTIKTDEEALAVLRMYAKHCREGRAVGNANVLDEVVNHLAQRLAAVDGWLPIESAPRTPVLLYYPAWGAARGREGFTHPEMFRVDYPNMIPRKATHWRPLPPAPSRQEG